MGALEIVLAALGIGLIACGYVLRLPLLAVCGAVAIGAAYALLLPSARGPRVIVTAPLLAGALLIAVEAAFAVSAAGEDWRSDLRRSAARLLISGCGAVVVAALVMLATTAQVARSLPLTIAGTLAAVGAVALLRERSRS